VGVALFHLPLPRLVFPATAACSVMSDVAIRQYNFSSLLHPQHDPYSPTPLTPLHLSFIAPLRHQFTHFSPQLSQKITGPVLLLDPTIYDGAGDGTLCSALPLYATTPSPLGRVLIPRDSVLQEMTRGSRSSTSLGDKIGNLVKSNSWKVLDVSQPVTGSILIVPPGNCSLQQKGYYAQQAAVAAMVIAPFNWLLEDEAGNDVGVVHASFDELDRKEDEYAFTTFLSQQPDGNAFTWQMPSVHLDSVMEWNDLRRQYRDNMVKQIHFFDAMQQYFQSNDDDGDDDAQVGETTTKTQPTRVGAKLLKAVNNNIQSRKENMMKFPFHDVTDETGWMPFQQRLAARHRRLLQMIDDSIPPADDGKVDPPPTLTATSMPTFKYTPLQLDVDGATGTPAPAPASADTGGSGASSDSGSGDSGSKHSESDYASFRIAAYFLLALPGLWCVLAIFSVARRTRQRMMEREMRERRNSMLPIVTFHRVQIEPSQHTDEDMDDVAKEHVGVEKKADDGTKSTATDVTTAPQLGTNTGTITKLPSPNPDVKRNESASESKEQPATARADALTADGAKVKTSADAEHEVATEFVDIQLSPVVPTSTGNTATASASTTSDTPAAVATSSSSLPPSNGVHHPQLIEPPSATAVTDAPGAAMSSAAAAALDSIDEEEQLEVAAAAAAASSVPSSPREVDAGGRDGNGDEDQTMSVQPALIVETSQDHGRNMSPSVSRTSVQGGEGIGVDSSGKQHHISGTACSICLSDFVEGDRLKLLPCSHAFCSSRRCIDTWLAKSDQCPVCRANIMESMKSPPCFMCCCLWLHSQPPTTNRSRRQRRGGAPRPLPNAQHVAARGYAAASESAVSVRTPASFSSSVGPTPRSSPTRPEGRRGIDRFPWSFPATPNGPDWNDASLQLHLSPVISNGEDELNGESSRTSVTCSADDPELFAMEIEKGVEELHRVLRTSKLLPPATRDDGSDEAASSSATAASSSSSASSSASTTIALALTALRLASTSYHRAVSAGSMTHSLALSQLRHMIAHLRILAAAVLQRHQELLNVGEHKNDSDAEVVDVEVIDSVVQSVVLLESSLDYAVSNVTRRFKQAKESQSTAPSGEQQQQQHQSPIEQTSLNGPHMNPSASTPPHRQEEKQADSLAST